MLLRKRLVRFPRGWGFRMAGMDVISTTTSHQPLTQSTFEPHALRATSALDLIEQTTLHHHAVRTITTLARLLAYPIVFLALTRFTRYLPALTQHDRRNKEVPPIPTGLQIIRSPALLQ